MKDEGFALTNKDLIEKFLTKYPWPLLEKVIRGLPKTRTKVTRGGVRLNSKSKKLIVKALEKECSNNPEIMEGFFIAWFNEHSIYNELLQDFFQSEDHKILQAERGVEKSHYVVDDEHFDKLVDAVQSEDIDFFLQLSPIVFSDEQAEKLSDIKRKYNQFKLPQIDTAESTVEEKKNKSDLFSKAEKKVYNRELKKKEKQINELENENKKLRTKNQNVKAAFKEELRGLKDLNEYYLEEIKFLSDQKQLLEEELSKNHKKISKIKEHNKGLEKKAEKLEEQLIRLENEKERPFHDIISKIDLNELLSALNAPDNVLEVLSTIVKPPETDGTGENGESSASLPEFWQKLNNMENELVNNIFDATISSIHDKSFFDRWSDKTDEFIDLKCSLSARYFLVDILYEILQQYYSRKGA